MYTILSLMVATFLIAVIEVFSYFLGAFHSLDVLKIDWLVSLIGLIPNIY